MQVARDPGPRVKVVTLLYDRAERHVSTSLFEEEPQK